MGTSEKRDLLALLSAVFCVMLFVGLPLAAHAAQLFIEPPRLELPPDRSFEAHVFLDAQPDDVNAVEGSLTFPTDDLALTEIRDGDSIISLWVERPSERSGTIRFSGIIPGGYRFPKGQIMTLVFEPKRPAEGSVEWRDVRLLRNDGKGTPIVANVTPFRFVIAPGAPRAPIVIPIHDTDPPEPFTPQITRDPKLFEGRWFAVFATQDKASGIDHYEVQESYVKGLGAWVTVSSPSLLRDQRRLGYVSIKAVDKAGNIRLEVVPPSAPYLPYVIYGILILVLGGLWIAFLFWRKKRAVTRRS